jgi:hypothetical protein
MALDRRTFLRALGLSGAGLVLGNHQANSFDNRMDGFPRIGGSVKSDSKPLQNVVVSDGFSVTSTDAKGKYELVLNPFAEFVFLSVPRGYAFANDKGIANFYKRLTPGEKKLSADFELEKLPVDDTRHNFIVWADPQIQDAEDAKLLTSESVPDTHQLVKSYGADALFHGIGCGDLVWDKFELFAEYKSAIATVGIPFFQVIGNHDMDLDARADDGSSTTFRNHFGPTYYSFNRGAIHYVVLDDVFFLGSSRQYIGYITEQQLAWLEKDLSFIEPGSTVVVYLHIPANTGEMMRYKMKEGPIDGVVSNRQDLYRILKPFKTHIMSGHTHYNEKIFDAENVMEHVHGSLCGAWWTGPICFDGTPSGYGVYEVNGSELTWYYKAVGKDRNHQMRVYPVGAVPEMQDSFAVNVWNWDHEWKVEWYEDDIFKGPLQRVTSLDPWAVQLQKGTDKPSKRTWVEPHLTDHMFFGKPSAGARGVTIKVTDRFGTVYKEELTTKGS